MPEQTWPGWARELAIAMGWKPSPAALQLLEAWAACEGGGAHFNPLNTTLYLAGSTPANSAGVRNYLDRVQGLAATMLTLRLPFYGDVRLALAAPDLTAAQRLPRAAVGIGKWGTNVHCIQARLSGHHAAS